MKKISLERPGYGAVQIDGGFWGVQMLKFRTVTAWDVLNKFESEGILKNYEYVREGRTGKHVGPPWYDGLICETIRGISDLTANARNADFEKRIDAIAEAISLAQGPDGYLSTYTTLICPAQRWGENGGNLLYQHETYNMSCLAEAGIHYYMATGKNLLLKCGVCAANCMSAAIGPAPRKNIVPAHPLGEEAMVKLYRLLTDRPELAETLKKEYGVPAKAQDYLDLAEFWIDHRGVHDNRASFPHYMGEYAQDHCPVSEQSEIVGHAVRAALLYTGVTAAGIETGKQKYLDAAARLWNNMTQTKLHISGGIGAVHNEERFGYQYDLPNDAYLETCAGAAVVFWAGEMHRAFGDAACMDVLERALYNNVLPCLSADGTHYFYENPLVSDGTPERWSWHSCPCCPPMFLKVMGALPGYIYSVGKNCLSVNLYIGSTFRGIVDGRRVTILQDRCGLPWSGGTRLTISPESPFRFSLRLRVPEWAGKIAVSVCGQALETETENGYLTLTRDWSEGDEVELSLELPIRKIQAHPYVDADAGRVAIQRGPLLYCAEGIDNDLSEEPVLSEEEAGVLTGPGGLPDGAVRLRVPTERGRELTMIPYYLWNNRGKAKMTVWLRQNGCRSDKLNTDGWQGKLYRVYCPKK